ncbi:hypothetical protein BU25DRAFT_449083 [Macroventuria anomochaeta]|uniref:Uncharacterized protein n=1 Tax=Macroventuria anomochaeta TaxID=301207 RepID=A0ACB6RYI0_9PLEO|nr:uncharacterized protein BU25DRAFT_449083 [Macroventuria anomochaeta]KAF2626926.1 hypothetical protein BU25DRAFT_449083 [Macroventuria anomochaeta]
MSAFRDIMSIVGPGGAKITAASKQLQSQPAGASKHTPRPAADTNGATPAPQLKRKASGTADNSQVKVQRKDSPAQSVQYTGTARPTATPGAARLSQSTTTTVPYRGTAAPSSTKPANTIAKKPTAPASTAAAPRKATPPTPKPASTATTSTTAAPASKPKGYLALLQKAKEKDLTKPAAPPVTVAAKGFIPTKKERLALKAEASAAKGKKPGVVPAAKAADVKGDASKVHRKPAEVGYQGTARPAKTAAPIGYKGTARPQSTTAPSSRGGTPAVKPKPKPEKGRYDGYADWSDLDDMKDDEEDDYASDVSSDMEGGMWDVEQEEQLALKAAKKEDAEALAEEMRLKREKEEKKRKLMALSKAAAAKKKY